MTINNNQAKDQYGNAVKRGRPSKDVIAYKPFMKHDWDRIKEENRVAYAENVIKNAKNLYKRYDMNYPNPLNIDAKELEKESRECWEYIFSQRDYDDSITNTVAFNNCRAFENPDEVIFAFECYTNYIRKNNFVREFIRPDGDVGLMPIIPNQSNLARWLGVCNNRINEPLCDNESARKKYMNMLADILSEGAMAGVYQAGSTQFALKNMCDWADKYEDKSYKRDTSLAVEEANDLMKQLGYVREKAKLEPPKPLLESDTNG